MKTTIAIHACLAIASCPLLLATAADIPEPPGKIDVCWIGNTFSGNHDEEGNGYGLWVQNAADEIEVTADGLVAAGCGWDEAGRCAGLYRDGKVNRDLLKNRSQPESAWGFDTGNGALAFDGNSLYVVNHGGRLLRFSGDTKDLESWRFVESCELGIVPIAANAFDGVLAIATTNHVELRKCDAPAVPITTWDLPAATAGEATSEIKDLAFDAQGRLWVIVGDGIRLFQTADSKLEEIPCGSFKSLTKPEAIARDASNPRLMIVCDNGPDKQVKFYDVSKPKSPKLKKTFGDKGGIFSKKVQSAGRRHKPIDGENFPTRFTSLRGAGTDAQGNLYVAMGLNNSPCGNLTIRSLSPAANLLWEVDSMAFVDTFSVDPTSDGSRIVTRTGFLSVDLDSSSPDLDWKVLGTCVDPEAVIDDDERPFRGQTAYLRRLDGHNLLFTIGQYAHGYRFFTFDEDSGSMVAKPAGSILAEDYESWGWDMDGRGDVWQSDHHPNHTIRRFRFKGWKNANAESGARLIPDYETENPEEWPWPDDFSNVTRVIYTAEDDSLYLTGYLKTDEYDSWGLCGKTLRRYNGWISGNPTIAWTIALPVDPHGLDGDRAFSCKGFATAGDYLFVSSAKAIDGLHRTFVLDKKDGRVLGAFKPRDAVSTNVGWHDMPYSVTAFRRSNGEYMVIIEEDARAKNILYRWTPPPQD